MLKVRILSKCLHCNGEARMHLSRSVECVGCESGEVFCTCEWYGDGPIDNEPAGERNDGPTGKA